MSSPVQSLRALVIDDDAAIRELLETVLRRDGFEVTSLEDPTLAESTVRTGRFHFVLLDLMMPGQDGIETLQRIRKVDRDLAVVVITGYPSLDTAVQSMKLDALDYLRKPFTVEDLRAVVERILKKKGLSRTPEEQLHRAIGETIRAASRSRADVEATREADESVRVVAVPDRAGGVLCQYLVPVQDRRGPRRPSAGTLW